MKRTNFVWVCRADKRTGAVEVKERGDTLVEVLITVLVVGITSVALLLGFTTSISGSAAHRALTSNDVALRSISQAVYAQVEGQTGTALYATCPVNGIYGSSTLSSEFSAPTGYSVLVKVAEYWYSGQWNPVAPSTCGSNAPAVPQQLLITMTTPNQRTLTTTIVVTQPLAIVNTFAISSLTPSAAAPGTSGLNVTINGTGFDAGAIGSFPSGSGITFTNTNSSVSPPSSPQPSSWTVVSRSSIIAKIDVSATAPLGPVTFTLTNSDGITASKTFTISTGPTITNVSPAAMLPGASGVSFTITGANFSSQQDTRVAFSDPTVFTFSGSPGWTVNSSTSITATISVSSTANPGQYSVAVTDTNLQQESNPYAVTVSNPPPVVTAVSGGGTTSTCTISSSSTVTCAVAGKYFDPSVTVDVSQTAGNYNACTPVPTVIYNSATSLSLTFAPSNYQPANCSISGSYDLTVFGVGGQSNLFTPAFSSS